MAFEWTDKQDGVNDILAKDINAIANEVIRIAEEGVGGTELTQEQIDNINSISNKADRIDLINLAADTEVALGGKADKEYVDTALGTKADLSTAAGGFIAGNVVQVDGGELNEDTFGGVAIGNQVMVWNNQPSGVGIGNQAEAYEDSVSIGDGARTTDTGCVAIGSKAVGWMEYSIGIGQEAYADWRCIAIGYKALADLDNIQLGTGHNTESSTFQVYDYQLLDADGNIPSQRLKTSRGGFVGGNVEYHSGNNVVIGNNASAPWGGNAIGKNAAIGVDNGTLEHDTTQIGDGQNNNENTLQFRDYQLLDAEGNVPIERLSKATTYTDTAIGDIETALDNIVAKYGLGGDVA